MEKDLTPITEEDTKLSIVAEFLNAMSNPELVITPEMLATPAFSNGYEALASFLGKAEDCKKFVDGLIKGIAKANYEATGDTSICNDKYRFTYVAPTTRESFDSKKFKADQPELYKKYVKVGNVSDSLKTYKLEK